MNLKEWKKLLQAGALSKYAALYPNVQDETQRYLQALDAFAREFGENRDIRIFSTPGRTEVCGNHTDHNLGKVFAAAITRDNLAIVSPNDDGIIRLHSEGYPLDEVELSKIKDKDFYPAYSSLALIAGTCQGFLNASYKIGGFDAYTTTEVLKGSGISSSAAFEVQIGNILKHLYNGGAIDNQELAKIAQYAENTYFGKPCGLMDQMACAVGGFLSIDFEDPKKPVVTPIDFSLDHENYALCIVNTGGNHANLNEDYASVPKEMKAVAGYFGKPVLRAVSKEDFFKSIPVLRGIVGDRAILRAFHYFEENERVEKLIGTLQKQDFASFLHLVKESGRSSFEYLQNVYTVINVEEQGLSLALALTESFLQGKAAAWRVHGGGFAGTIQVFLPKELKEDYKKVMDYTFGEGATMMLSVRPLGAIEINF